jgi:hypothetical protein
MNHLLPLLGRLDLRWTNFGPGVMVDQIREHLPNAVIHGQLAPFTFSRNDELEQYRREFRGPVGDWIGRYAPGEDLPDDTPELDPESMSNWRICYYIERV